MADWRPIETAPKDGRHVILLDAGHPDDYHTRVVNAFWGDMMAGYEPDDQKNYAWCNWHMGLRKTSNGETWYIVLSPTHWRPLPPPPEPKP